MCESKSIGVTIGNVVEEHDGGADGPGLCRVADKSLSLCGAAGSSVHGGLRRIWTAFCRASLSGKGGACDVIISGAERR